MDYLMGIRGKDFVMVCSDTTASQQIIVIKHDEDKLRQIDSHMVMALSGEPGDRVQFSEYIIANTKLYALRNGQKLTTDSVASFTRNQLADALRKVGQASFSRAQALFLLCTSPFRSNSVPQALWRPWHASCGAFVCQVSTWQVLRPAEAIPGKHLASWLGQESRAHPLLDGLPGNLAQNERGRDRLR